MIVLDLEDRQQMRDRWLRGAFAVGLPSPSSEVESNSPNDNRTAASNNGIDEEEAIRLLIDYGISEDKAKVRLQVRRDTVRFSSSIAYFRSIFLL